MTSDATPIPEDWPDDEFVVAPTDDREAAEAAIKWYKRIMFALPTNANANRRLVWLVLKTSDAPLSRHDLSEATGLPYSSIHNAVDDLETHDLVDAHHQAGKSTATLYTPTHGGYDDAE